MIRSGASRWSLGHVGARWQAFRLAATVLVAALLGGCFQPLYGEHSPTGGPGIREAVESVKVLPINAPQGSDAARLAVEVRNQVIFDLTGGGSAAPPTHELTILMTSSRQGISVDPNLVSVIEIFALDATFTLKELASGKTVVTAQTSARSSYDIPGATQRFVRLRGMRDAENRAAKVIADQIRDRLASYFVAGT